MSPAKRCAKKHAKARHRRYLKAQERLERDCRQAQHAAKILEQALDDLGLPEDLVTEIEGRLRSQHKLLGKIVGVMCPPLFGCRTSSELCRVRGWDKNLPSRLLGALPKRSWLKRLRRLGVDVLVPLWRHAANKSEATRSRWQWTWVSDDSVFKKYGDQEPLWIEDVQRGADGGEVEPAEILPAQEGDAGEQEERPEAPEAREQPQPERRPRRIASVCPARRGGGGLRSLAHLPVSPPTLWLSRSIFSCSALISSSAARLTS